MCPPTFQRMGRGALKAKRAQRKEPTLQFIQIPFKLGNGEHIFVFVPPLRLPQE